MILKRYLFPIALMLAFVTACSGGEAAGVAIDYLCTGTASEATITYTASDGEPVTETTSLPWEQSINRTGNLFGFGLEAVSSTDGNIRCSIMLEGEEIANETDDRSIELVAEYTFSGGVREVNVTSSTSSDEPVTEFDLEGAAFILENRSNFEICEIYVTPTPEEGWGENLLSPGSQLPAGERFPLEEVPTEETGIRVVDCDGRVIAINGTFGVDLSDDAVLINNLGRTRPSLVSNQIQEDICVVRASRNDDNFSPNLLREGGSIPPAELRLFRLPVGAWAMQIETCSGETLTVENISLQPQVGYALNVTSTSLLVGSADASGNIITLTIYNAGATPVCAAYVTDATQDDTWGDNLIEDEIAEGENATIRDLAIGLLDIKLEDCEGNIVDLALNVDFFELVREIGPNVPYTTNAAPNVVVSNETGADVCVLQFNRPEVEITRNLLEDPLPADEELDIILAATTLTLTAETCDGETFVLPDQDVDAGYTWVISQEAVDAAQADEEE